MYKGECRAVYRRNYLSLYVHLVWGTWERQPLLCEPTRQHVYRAIGAKCAELGADLVALGGMEDHVHLLVSLPSTLTIANLAGQVKGVSSHLVNHEAPLPTGELFKWQGTYGAFTVSQPLVRTVADYILHQREHHTLGTLKDEWEESYKEVQPAEGTPAAPE